MSYATIKLELETGLATLTLNRPDKRNAISYELIDDLLRALEEVKCSTAEVLICPMKHGNRLAYDAAVAGRLSDRRFGGCLAQATWCTLTVRLKVCANACRCWAQPLDAC